MTRVSFSMLIGGFLLLPVQAPAQVAGSTVIGVAAAEMREVTLGWSAKREILGKTVFNDKSQRIGTIDDLIITPYEAAFYAIIGARGFLGVDRHDVAIPVWQLKEQAGKLAPPAQPRRR
jgi:hypothetical protein